MGNGLDAMTMQNDAERLKAFLAGLGVDGSDILGTFDKDRHVFNEIGYMLDLAMPIAVSILDPDMRYVFINSQCYRMNNLTLDDIRIGMHLSEVHANMKRKGLLTEQSAMEGKIDPVLIQKKGVHEDDTRILGLANGSYQRLTRRKLSNGYTVSIGEDVTDLVMRNKLLQRTLMIGMSGYWIYDFGTKTYEVSKSLKLIFTPEQVELVLDKGPLPAIHEKDRARFADALRCIAQTDDRFEIETRLAFLGPVAWFRSTVQLLRNPDGTPRQIQCFVQDITRQRTAKRDLEKAKDEAVAANLAKSQFLANMSHEIRTPMNGVLGMAELLAGSALDDRQREFVNVITQSATSLLTVINDILDFSKIEADALELETAPFSLRDTVSEVASLLSQKAGEKGIELIVDYPAQTPHSFLGDGTRVRQILTNLVGNAIKFTDDGHVLIRVESGGVERGVRLSVVDTGIGIPEDKVDQVFEKFTQADNSTTRIYGGTGLGLSISRRLAQLMGGDLSVTSTYGEGSTFTALLPLNRDRSAKPIVRNTAPLKGKRALIVDDIDINRRLLSEQLTGWGMSVKTAPNGVEALMALKESHKADNEPFDIIVMDYLMPGVNGRELANMIHAQPELDLPILMLSSCDERQTHDERTMEGVDRYLVKPVREQTLFDAVVAMIYDDSAQRVLPPVTQSKPATRTKTQKRSGIEILVAEDFPLNQDVVRLMLADTRYDPVIVENGKLAAELYAEDMERFAAILMDVSMPVMDGYTATGAIRDMESEASRRCPIIALTGHALTNEREKCIDAGMDDYLTKPVKQGELIAALDRASGNATRVAVA